MRPATPKTRITVIPGDGIGPAITHATLEVLKRLECGFSFDFALAGLAAQGKTGSLLPPETSDLIRKNKVVLKGPLTTPVGEGFSSINVQLRQAFDLYANVRPARSYSNTKTRYKDIDLVTIRENTEGLYSGEGQRVVKTNGDERAEALSVVTRKGAQRVLKFAFELVQRQGRKKITVVHKANILKSTSALFLQVAREVAKEYPAVPVQEMLMDNACMQLVLNPHQFDVIVTTNLFGDIISDICAGLVGGLGLAPSANIGKDAALFEAVHGSAPDIAGKNIANPSALMLAAALMLEHVGLADKAQAIRRAIESTLAKKDHLTPDLGGKSATDEFTQAVLKRL